jgi:hypothetical protein
MYYAWIGIFRLQNYDGIKVGIPPGVGNKLVSKKNDVFKNSDFQL